MVYYTLSATPKSVTSKQDGQKLAGAGAGAATGSASGARTMATAIGDSSLFGNPFDGLHPSPIPSLESPSMQPYYHLRPFDAAHALRVDFPERPPQTKWARTTQEGLSGDTEELVAVFNACLQVRKIERAQLVLKRLGQLENLPPNQLVALHNRYLKASLDQMRQFPDATALEQLHKWYELQIRRKGLAQTAETVACMLKVSILSQRGARLARSVSRYMGMAPGNAGLEVLSMADILTDQDLATITRICPTYNLVRDDDHSLPTDESATAAVSESNTKVSPTVPVTPEVKPTPQKGMSLKLVRETLSLFDELPQGLDVSSLGQRERQEIQSRLERDCVDSAIRRWREESDHLQKMGLNTIFGHQSLGSRMHDWHLKLEKRIKEELKKVEESETKTGKKIAEDFDRCTYGPFLRQSTPSRLAAVTILGAINCTAIMGIEKGAKLSSVINGIAKLVEEDIREQSSRENKRFSKRSGSRRRVVQAAFNGQQELSGEEVTASDGRISTATPPVEASPDKPWPATIQAKVGAALLSALIQTAKIRIFRTDPETKETISQEQRAFHHTKKLRKGKKLGMLFVNDGLAELLKKEPNGNFLAKHLPMVVEPRPWSKFREGAFFDTTANLVRLRPGEKDQQMYTEAAIARGDLDQVLKSLDVLGKTAWRVNVPVMNVMLEAWNQGDEIADIPALSPNISYPDEPADHEDRQARGAYYRAVTASENKKSGLHSVRCFNNLQLEVARAFRNQTFYLPHNIDFRGRAYPLPTYLNHMGADNVRGLLRFGKGKELGERGLWWLKVHLANVFGFSKASLCDRVAFTDDHMVNVMDSANHPLTGKRWWLEADDPWQTLAACFEVKAALESPDPTRFISTLPVHQDGSCNGLQHYAALGGDMWGAQQVNLEPGDRPADVYSAVADVVIDLVNKDAEQGIPFAKAVQGKVTRKVVKQTVMTNVYGVTFAGARKQVCKQLDDLYPNLEAESGFPPILLASYISRYVFKALSSMFYGAHEIQAWLGETGGRICTALSPDQIQKIAQTNSSASKARFRTAATPSKTAMDELTSKFKSTIVWTTPLRMPVAQPYRKSSVKVVKTCIQDLSLTIPTTADPVNRRKQLQAFPPNFIHSLDASHMMLSALQCDDNGLTFAAVHDSFWTHATDVDKMNNILRDSFVRIHGEDVIGRLAAEFEARYQGSIYMAKVKQASVAGKKVIEWRKEHKVSFKDELILENERQKLLRSSDPEEVSRGKEMETPASILESNSEPDSLVAPDGADEIGLGRIIESDAEAAPAGGDMNAEDASAHEEGVEMDWIQRTLQNYNKSPFQIKMEGGAPAKKQRAPAKTTPVWLPLTLPPVPQKGDFDVHKLMTSQYFFS